MLIPAVTPDSPAKTVSELWAAMPLVPGPLFAIHSQSCARNKFTLAALDTCATIRPMSNPRSGELTFHGLDHLELEPVRSWGSYAASPRLWTWDLQLWTPVEYYYFNVHVEQGRGPMSSSHFP